MKDRPSTPPCVPLGTRWFNRINAETRACRIDYSICLNFLQIRREKLVEDRKMRDNPLLVVCFAVMLSTALLLSGCGPQSENGKHEVDLHSLQPASAIHKE